MKSSQHARTHKCLRSLSEPLFYGGLLGSLLLARLGILVLLTFLFLLLRRTGPRTPRVPALSREATTAITNLPQAQQRTSSASILAAHGHLMATTASTDTGQVACWTKAQLAVCCVRSSKRTLCLSLSASSATARSASLLDSLLLMRLCNAITDRISDDRYTTLRVRLAVPPNTRPWPWPAEPLTRTFAQPTTVRESSHESSPLSLPHQTRPALF